MADEAVKAKDKTNDKNETLMQIRGGHFTAGIIFTGSKVTEAAPILGYMRGWELPRVEAYCKKQGWGLSIVSSLQAFIDRHTGLGADSEGDNPRRTNFERQARMRDQLHAGPLGTGFTPVENVPGAVLKPMGGLWTSTYTPLGEYDSDWMRYCRPHKFEGPRSGQVFCVSPKARLLKIHSHADLLKALEGYGLPPSDDVFGNMFGFRSLDFEKLAESYDGVHLTEEGERATRFRFNREVHLIGWDCESTLWFNVDCLKFDREVPLRPFAKRLATTSAG